MSTTTTDLSNPWVTSDDASRLAAQAPAGPIEDRWASQKFSMKLVNPANRRK